MLDPQSLLLVNIRLDLFLFNSFIEVEIMIPGLSRSYWIWELLKSMVPVFHDALDKLKAVERNGWEGSGVSRQSIES